MAPPPWPAAIARTEEDLLRLVHAHLVQRTTAERFAFHDLIREYARSRSTSMSDTDRSAAVKRLYTYYRVVSDAADRVLQPGALRLPIRVDQAWSDSFPRNEPAARWPWPNTAGPSPVTSAPTDRRHRTCIGPSRTPSTAGIAGWRARRWPHWPR